MGKPGDQFIAEVRKAFDELGVSFVGPTMTADITRWEDDVDKRQRQVWPGLTIR
jgi:hypothetical protein